MTFLGVILLFVWISLPSLQRLYLERDIYVKASSSSMYSDDLEEGFNTIKKELKIEGDTKVKKLNVEFDGDGIINNIEFLIFAKDKDGVYEYKVRYGIFKRYYRISRNHSIHNFYPRSALGDKELFYVMERINFEEFTQKTRYETYRFSASGFYGGEGQKNSNMFAITEQGAIEWNQEGLRDKGYTFILSGEPLDDSGRSIHWEYILPVER